MTISLRLTGDHSMREFIIRSVPPFYTATSSTYPIDLCARESLAALDVTRYVEDPAAHLPLVWERLLCSGHFLMAQFGHDGVITLWAGGSTAPCDVEAMLMGISFQGAVIELRDRHGAVLPARAEPHV